MLIGMLQKTIQDMIEFSGIGLHSGLRVKVRVSPSAEDTGICFIRKDLPGSPPIKAVSRNVVATNFATTLGSGGVTIGTVEHLMAAFYGLGVDNALVEVEGPELPIMDGSAAHFVDMIEEAGLATQSAPRKYLVIKRPIRVGDEEDKFVHLFPAEGDGLSIDYSIDFAHPYLNRQSFSGHLSKDVFTGEIVDARTFTFHRDVEILRKKGLAKGGSLSNALVIGDTSILNESGLRYPDEFVRHKVLDIVGDIALLGMPIVGRLVAHRSGHALNHKFVQKVLKNARRWEVVDSLAAEEPAARRPALTGELATA
ncbi:MAG: UDP-3-O-acyl-N-acetylglucosamine deacetylase [Thermodesulfobacteriota bacterium]